MAVPPAGITEKLPLFPPKQLGCAVALVAVRLAGCVTVKVRWVKVHPLLSVTLNECVPAQSPVYVIGEKVGTLVQVLFTFPVDVGLVSVTVSGPAELFQKRVREPLQNPLQEGVTWLIVLNVNEDGAEGPRAFPAPPRKLLELSKMVTL